jgi:lambda repressor-like predicted transcriptional regulator
MSKHRRLRRLVPDEALFDRRVAGESLRALARDYGVEHSTLMDFFRRPDGVLGLEEAHRRLQGARRAGKATERELQQNVRKRAREDMKHDRRLKAWARRRTRRSDYEGWLDERDGPRGLSSRERFSVNDDLAEAVVEAGGGVEQVIDVTGLRTRENALHGVDPQIMRSALANDAKFPSNARPDDLGLRRLVPDSELIRRGAAAESLRSIAADYGVSHTTILRYFKRPEVSKQLLRTQRLGDRPRCRA